MLKMAPPKAQSQQPSSPAYILIKDLRPTAFNNINTVFIILEKGPAVRGDNGVTASVCLAADQSAAVHLQLWGTECEYFQPGDIVRMNRGIFTSYNGSMILRAGKKGKLEKIGEFTMVFSEVPNMSKLQWVQDPSNSTLWNPVGLHSPRVAQTSCAGPSSSQKAS
ncbi:hypothetical protein L7F22_000615 [Adiantum nelumboides]|nr:hypothetical protein [Adiantum nelumboides]